MKYIKTFENSNKEPYYGDYVAIESNNKIFGDSNDNEIFKITDIIKLPSGENGYQLTYTKQLNSTIYVYPNEIVFFSDNIKDVEKFLEYKKNSKKYNL